MHEYEFHAFFRDDEGKVIAQPTVTILPVSSLSEAEEKAGRLSRLINGNVDLAFTGKATWEVRYITTASPSRAESVGYTLARIPLEKRKTRFERMNYAVGVGNDPDDLAVSETEDGFGAFKTKEAAAERLIAMIDERMETLRRSKARARRIVRSAVNSK